MADKCYIHKHDAFVYELQYKLSTKAVCCKIDVSRLLKWHHNFSQALRSSSSGCPIASGFESGSKSANRLNQADIPWLPLLGAIKKEKKKLASQIFEITLLYFYDYKVDGSKSKKFKTIDKNCLSIMFP